MINDIKVIQEFFTPDESLAVRLVFNELLSQVPNLPRKMLTTPEDDRLIFSLLKTLDKIKEVSGVDELYIAEFLINIYFEGFFMGIHTDTEDSKGHFAVSAVAYFNSDYEGGEITFPNIPMAHKPQEGDLVVFPSSDDRFNHGVSVIRSGMRYVMPIWTTQDKSMASTFVHPNL